MVALSIVDTNGLAGLTMRSLAEALGVKPMSLYHHVPNKEAILDGLVDLVFGEIEVPPAGIGWRDGLRLRTQAVRRVLGHHRWAIGLLESRTSPGPATLQHHNSVLALLRESGFSVSSTAHVYSLLDSYAYGFALQEASLPFDGPESVAEAAESFLTLPLQEYPFLVEMLTEHVMKPGYDFGAEFDFGLEVLLDSIERLRVESPAGLPSVGNASAGNASAGNASVGNASVGNAKSA